MYKKMIMMVGVLIVSMHIQPSDNVVRQSNVIEVSDKIEEEAIVVDSSVREAAFIERFSLQNGDFHGLWGFADPRNPYHKKFWRKHEGMQFVDGYTQDMQYGLFAYTVVAVRRAIDVSNPRDRGRAAGCGAAARRVNVNRRDSFLARQITLAERRRKRSNLKRTRTSRILPVISEVASSEVTPLEVAPSYDRGFLAWGMKQSRKLQQSEVAQKKLHKIVEMD